MNISWIFEGDFTFETGVNAFEEFKNLSIKPNAIFAGNDDMANGFMESAKKEGYLFPDDVAIMGYNDSSICRHNQPTISSIKTDYETLGMATMKLLREAVRHPGQDSNMLSFVPVSVVHRESS